MIYTTGTVTLKNYIQMKAGLKAEFHHVWGALLVEVDSDGDWFVRQINATSDGSFYDLDAFVENGKVTRGHRVEGINWGDIHVTQQNATVFDLAWGSGGILDTLKSKYQFYHDLLDFHSRSHHEMDNCHEMFKKYVTEEDNVENEVINTGLWTKEAHRDWCQAVVVDSNHDGHLKTWLRDANFKYDHVNAEYYLRAQARLYKAIRDRDENFSLVEWALREGDCAKNLIFLRPDQSFILCPDHGGGIECGLHGHYGPNGSRGGRSLIRLGRKANVGHSHVASIIDGVYTAGTCSEMRLVYTHGPSSWSWSLIVTYSNGKRCVLTIRNGKWKAG